MTDILRAILQEVDADIKQIMTEYSDTPNDQSFYRNYELINNPELTALKWQEMRDRKQNGTD